MFRRVKRTITLLELLIVITTIGIIALMSVPRYMRGAENSRDKEAQALLRLVAYAERFNRLETGGYIACADTAACRNILNIELRSDDWAYSVVIAGPGFTARAVRTGGSDAGRRWEMDQDDDRPDCVAGKLCP